MKEYDLDLDNAWLGLGDTRKIHIKEHILDLSSDIFDNKNPHFFLIEQMLDIENVYFTCKHLLQREISPQQALIIKEMWNTPFPMLICTRGWGKTFILGLYSVLRAVILQGRKIVITGGSFRQAKQVFEHCKAIWDDSAILRDFCKKHGNQGPKFAADRLSMRIGDSYITAIPLGNGDKIRGERANDTIADEFSIINTEVFETVIGGFSVVSSSPIEKIKMMAKLELMKQAGVLSKKKEQEILGQERSNQTLISGTADFAFGHYFKYWKRWKGIIESGGDPRKLKEVIGNEVSGLNWKDFKIIRIPTELVPKGYFDEKQIARSKATIHCGIYNSEYGACFVEDSTGFFKRSLIESCVTKEPIELPTGPVQFHPLLAGNPYKKYVIGIDPASEQDNFSIVVLELCGDHRKVVYCWTTNRKQFIDTFEGEAPDQDFYGFCAKKIRELCNRFPVEAIVLDSQGGGIAVYEALHDKDKIGEKELPIWEVTEDHILARGKKNKTDDYPGLHILWMFNFADAKLLSEANHGLRFDMESKSLLFPYFDSISIEMAGIDDSRHGRIGDTMEDLYCEIEELKNELTTIVHTQTGTQLRDRWDTPEIKVGNKKGRMRKDRYSSLLMANTAARLLDRPQVIVDSSSQGVVAGKYMSTVDEKPYSGPDWFTKGTENYWDQVYQ